MRTADIPRFVPSARLFINRALLVLSQLILDVAEYPRGNNTVFMCYNLSETLQSFAKRSVFSLEFLFEPDSWEFPHLIKFSLHCSSMLGFHTISVAFGANVITHVSILVS